MSNPNLPNMSRVITKWFQTVSFIRITKTVVDHRIIETEVTDSFKGVVQNLDSRALRLKPQGQRAWTWKMIHALPSLILNNDDIMVYDGVRYRTMNIKNFKEYGYIEYHIVEDYQNG